MSDKSEVEQTHCVVSKVFAFSVPPLGSADGFKASLWPKQPIWVGRLRVVSKGDKCAVLLEHTDKEGLFASCPIQNSSTVESAIDSSRYFVLRLSDGKGRHALIGIGFNDRAQAFDFKVSLQDYENHNKEGSSSSLDTASKTDFSLPEGGSIHVSLGSKPKKKSSSTTTTDVSSAMAGLKLDAQTEGKEKKKKKKKDREEAPIDFGSFAPSASAASVVAGPRPATAAPGSSSGVMDFGFADFDPISSQPGSKQIDPFADNAAPAFGASNASSFSTPFDDTPSDWVKF